MSDLNLPRAGVHRRRGRARGTASGPARQVQVEALEARRLLAAVFWNVDSDGTWGNPANWSSNRVPGPNDDVFLDRPSGVFTVTHDGNADAVRSIQAGRTTLLVTGGSVSVSADSRFDGALVLANGTFSNDAALTLTGTTQWSGGTFAGPGVVVNQGNLLVNGSAPNNRETLATRLRNAGTFTVVDSAGLSFGGGTLENTSAGVVDLRTEGVVFSPGGGALINAGVVRKTFGADTNFGLRVDVPFDNAEGGVVEVATGLLRLSGGGTSAGGTFRVNAGAALDLTPGQGATTTLDGTYTGVGPGVVVFAGSTLRVAQGADTTFNFPDGLFRWRHGVIEAGARRFTNAGSLTVDGSSPNNRETVTGVLWNAGTVTVEEFAGLSVAAGAFENTPTGVLDFRNEAFVYNPGGGALNNAGVVRKSAGTDTSFGLRVQTPFNNAPGGRVEVETGRMRLGGGGSSTGGTFRVGANAVLDLTPDPGAAQTLDGSYTGQGPGAVVLGGGVVGVAVGADTTFQFPEGLFHWQGGVIQAGARSFVNAGAVLVDGDGPNNRETLVGTLVNRGTFTVAHAPNSSGQLILNGATLVNSGTYVQAGTANLRVTGGTFLNTETGDAHFSSHVELGGGSRLVNAGRVVTDYFGNLDVSLSSVENQAAGVFEVRNDLGLNGDDGSSFRNDGTFLRSAGSARVGLAFDNRGTVDAVGDLRFERAVAQLSGSALTGGRWVVRAGATVTLPAEVQTNQAFVTLAGAGAAFVNPAVNSGTLELLGGAELATVGLTNHGTLRVGEGSRLVLGTADGRDFTQSATGVLALDVGGDPAGGRFGRVTDPGYPAGRSVARLGGTLRVRLTGGYAPPDGLSFPALQFGRGEGAFAALDLPVAAGRPVFTVVTAADAVTLVSRGNTVDLAAESVDAPAAAVPGQPVTVSYTVRNTGEADVAGEWTDSLYLTTGTTLDAGAVLLGRVRHRGGVAGLGSYRETLTTTMPGAAGSLHVTVVVDSQLTLPELDRTRNTLASATRVAVSVPALQVDGPAARFTVVPGQDVYYRVDPTPGSDLLLDFSQSAGSAARLEVRRGAMPDGADVDQFTAPASLSQRLTVAHPQGGGYYLRVRGLAGAAGGAAVTLAASAAKFGATGFSPSAGANLGPVTLKIDGSGFTTATTATLTGPGGTLAPTRLLFRDDNTLIATFNLAGRAAGSYQVRVSDGLRDLPAPGAFRVAPGQAGRLTFSLTMPEAVRAGATGTAYLQYANAGETDLPAPMFTLVGDNARLRLATQTSFSPGPLEVLAVNPTGAAGVLPPGARGVIPVLFQPVKVGAHVPVSVTAVPQRPGVPIDWAASKDQLRPGTIAPDAWEAVYANVVDDLGGTTSTYAARLGQLATALSLEGVTTYDVGRLMTYEINLADDFGTLSRRYASGAYGRGQSDPYRLTATADEGGNVTVSSATEVRFFLRELDGSFRSQPGDPGVLTARPGGGYLLTSALGTVTAFGPAGRLDYVADTGGNRITARYDGGRLASLTEPNGDVTRFTYNAAGLVASVTDPVGRVASYTYDATNQHLLTVTTALGTTTYEYVTGRGPRLEHAVRSVTTPDGRALRFEYDARGRVASRTPTGLGATRFAYSPDGAVTVTDPGGQAVTTRRDDNGRFASATDATGAVFRAGYDASGLPSQNVLPGGLVTAARYGGDNRIDATVNALGGTTSVAYAPDSSRPASLTDALGHTTRFFYDPAGNVTATSGSPAGDTSYSYDARGRLATARDGAGRTTTLEYDAAGLLRSRTYGDGSRTEYTYDAHRNLKTVRDAAGLTTLTYDQADRLTGVTDPSGRTVAYRYDAAGRRVGLSTGDGFSLGYEYDPAGRLAAVKAGDGKRLAAYEYTAAGRLARATLGDGSVSSLEYDARGRVVRVEDRDPAGRTVSRFAYEYDPAGNVAAVTTPEGRTAYAYDGLGQLTAATLPDGRLVSYAYDAVGNRTASSVGGATTAYAVNGLNQYASAGGAAYTYDGAGNVLTRTDAAGETRYAYDAAGRLTGSTGPGGTWAFTYDAFGHLASTTRDGRTTQYLIDPTSLNSVLAEYQGGSLVANYAPGLGALLARVDAAGLPSYYHFDAAGNTAALTGPTGAVTDTYGYLPFGEAVRRTGTTPNPFTFVGGAGVVDAGNGLYRTQNRWYDPALGRFTSPDPLGFRGGDVNTYRYARNNPVASSDPTGLSGLGVVADHIIEVINELRYLKEVSAGVSTAAEARSLLHNATMLLSEVGGGAGAFEFAFENSLAAAAENLAVEIGETANDILMGTSAAAGDVAALDTVAVGTGAVDLSTAETIVVGAGTRAGVGARVAGGVSGFLGPIVLTVQAGVTTLDYLKTVTDSDYQAAAFTDNPLKVDYAFIQRLNNRIKDPVVNHVLQVIAKDPKHPTLDEALEALRVVNDYNNRKTSTSDQRTSFDPNDIVGPAGVGPGGHLAPAGVFPYTIRFENLPAASAPAVTVTVTHTLAPGLDLATFALGDFGFGPVHVTVPPGLQSYQTRVDARPGVGVLVDVDARLDQATRTVTWTFRSLDPATLDTPSGVDEGFLPPDDDTGRGEGFVTYTVSPAATLPTGARIPAKASIVFDTNEPIETRTVVNTIDSAGPSSAVAPLPAVSRSATFTVRWSGADDAGGSGVGSYSVYVSDDGGPFLPLVVDTAATSAPFTGRDGHTYRFYSVATDLVGYRQGTPTPQAQTTVRLQTGPGPDPGPSGYGAGRDAFVASLYREVLGRKPEARGLSFWSGVLARTGDTRAVAHAIWASPEHRLLVSQNRAPSVPLARAYQNALVAARRAHPVGPALTPARAPRADARRGKNPTRR